jgi:hypothetical protein
VVGGQWEDRRGKGLCIMGCNDNERDGRRLIWDMRRKRVVLIHRLGQNIKQEGDGLIQVIGRFSREQGVS